MRYFLTILFLTASFTSIYAGGIPKTMPDDFTILYHPTGVDVSNHHLVYLSLKECKAQSKVSYDAELKSYLFTIDKEELSSLYNALYSLNAFKLKSKRDIQKSRAGEEIIYVISGKRYVITNAATFFIVPKDLNHFNECVDLITACADRHRY